MTVTDEIASAAEQLESGDSSEAYDTIAAVLEYPAEITATDLPAALDVLARSAEELFGDDWGAVVGRAAGDAEQAVALGEAGSFLVEQGFAALAVTLLTHALRLDPGDGALLGELVTAHEQLGNHRGAVRVIEDADERAREGFLPQYLLAFNALMSFAPEPARTLAPQLRETAADDTQRFMAGRIEGMLSRLDALAAAGFADPPRTDLQVWHLVRTAGLLLDGGSAADGPSVSRQWSTVDQSLDTERVSDESIDDGRGARVEDSAASCRSAIERVAALLAALGVTPPSILSVPHDSSRVLANAAAQVLGLPSHRWPDRTEAPGLVVVYDIERLDGPVGDALAIHEADQVLWSHAVRWTIDHGVTPDIATFVHQHVVRPWEDELDGEGLPADAVSAWVELILDAEVAKAPTAADRDARLVRLAEATRGCGEHAAGVFRSSGRREKQFALPVVVDAF